MITNINHFSFTVSDLDKAVDFYKDVLGLEMVNICERDKDFSEKVTGIKNAYLRIAYLKSMNCSVELIQYLSPLGKKIDTSTCNVGSSHICFNVDNFDAMIKHLRQNSVRFSGQICIVPAGPNKGKKVLYFKDPDSNTIEIISNQKDGLSREGEI